MSQDEDKEIYLGDGLYFLFENYQFRLRAPRDNGDHVVYLEPLALTNILRILAKEEGWRNCIRGIVK